MHAWPAGLDSQQQVHQPSTPELVRRASAAGLMWDNLQNDKWFERLPAPGLAAAAEEAAAHQQLRPCLKDWEVRALPSFPACILIMVSQVCRAALLSGDQLLSRRD